jgi:hypothetical protein
MDRVRQWLNDRWQFFLPLVLLVILLAGLGLAYQGWALWRAQAAGAAQGGCGSGRGGGRLAEVGRLSIAQLAVRQWVQKKYGEEATIQFTKPEPVGDRWQVRVVVNGEVHATLLVDDQGKVQEQPLVRGQASVRKENKP